MPVPVSSPQFPTLGPRVGRPVSPAELAALGPALGVMLGPAAEAGRVGALDLPPGLDPVLYVGVSRGSTVYAGRTSHLPSRIARHLRTFEAEAVARPDVWLTLRVPASIAGLAEEGLIRALQVLGHPAQALRSRDVSGLAYTSPQARALSALGLPTPRR